MLSNKKREFCPLWLVVALDILLVGVTLLVFAFFHHALPAWKSERELQAYLAQQSLETPAIQEAESEIDVTTEPGFRTPWQEKFADHFTEQVEITDHSYTSPEVSVTIETVVEKLNGHTITYYVANVYVASLDNFNTYTAYDQIRPYVAQKAEDMAEACNAIFAISGDYFSNQKNGFVIRNGQIYSNDRNKSMCALYSDGTMETYDRGTYKVEDIMAKDPVQVWNFGPVLLNPDGTARDKFNITSAIRSPNPRSAIGYFEPGHYLLVVVDGRQNHSYGMTMPQLAQVFADRGCKIAYNLDGGGSAVALFGGKIYSKPSEKRDIADMIIVTEAGYTPHKKEEK